MSALRNEIVQRLTIIPDHKLGEVLSYINYLAWKAQNQRSPEDGYWLESDMSSLDSYEPYEWQEGELQEGLSVKFMAETGRIEIV